MQLSDHLQRLLRDHDCVIIPDFGGLIADYEPARLHPVRHTLAPPAKRVAFNQSLTRNDGLLVDALSRSQGLTAGQARQQVRDAVAHLQQELDSQQRTELPGIGIFRRVAGRGLDFEFTGAANLLPASYGLPELTSRPVRATDALLARERSRELPVPQLGGARRSRSLRRVFYAVAATMLISAQYQFLVMTDYVPQEWRLSVFDKSAPAPKRTQAANLAGGDFAEPFRPDGTPEEQPAIAKPAELPTEAVAEATRKAVTAAPAANAPAPATFVKPASSVAATPAATRTATTISGVTNRFYVVTGAFQSWKTVEQARQNLARKGKAAVVLLPRRGSRLVKGTRHFRLAVADFATPAQAQQSLPALRKQYGSDILVYNY
ncbi:SPOR domain-containing protein [Hymenobacter sp. B81]|uniref:HU domain-containing protein n=1 Tax=Hymenobacter sp. B81 TaxID=3344878 RepID=UPI0037DC1696